MNSVTPPALAMLALPIRKNLLLIAILFFTAARIDAQCMQTGTVSPASAWNDNATGSWGFSSPASAIFSDNSRASATATLALLGGHTDYLKVHDFKLNVPLGSTICGIQMKVEKSATGISVLAYVNDYRIRLMKGGAITGSNKSKWGAWSSTEQYFTYGGPTDLWGTTWTPSDINNTNFGLAISAEINGLVSVLPSAHINDVSVTVYYSQITLPVRLTAFNGKMTGQNQVKLDWITSGQDEHGSFTVQRSADGSNWTSLTTIAADASADKANYTYTDRSSEGRNSYYRIAIRNSTGAVTYSDVVTVMGQGPASVNIYPNPATNSVTITSEEMIRTLQCSNMAGTMQPVTVVKVSDNIHRMNIAHLAPGIYYIQVNGAVQKLIKK